MKLSFFRRRDEIPYDPAEREPAVRSGICTGEMVVGFIDLRTGKFHEYELAKNRAELQKFCDRVGVPPEKLRHIY